MAPPQIGDSIPDVTLYENTPNEAISLKELCAGKKVIIFGVPGAFTPTCSKDHLPSFLAQYDAIKLKEVAEIICVSVNDPFVMAAWGESYPTTGKIRQGSSCLFYISSSASSAVVCFYA
ncbi:hypothetical protein CYMTET_44768 [Cymbomonas tetramitiformis]|uniref:glutaredoxin-dependent peroxiredoxin n=1 Tax=Cymbomonas tetramitiformis TaxID=36881 RepID=A0AAE0EZ04_9CHLO|nr:hypothetical protein CYMTET_44768 [Cymbomonas tetramitiformis]|eukprot:gene11140-13162_t